MDIGFVSIFEAYNDFRVGVLYKKPQEPIWVCFNEAHFTCLFGEKKILQYITDGGIERYQDIPEGETEFIYYDALDDQKVLYTIKVKYNGENYKKIEYESYVENLIATLIPAVEFNWGKNDKLLC